VTEIAFHFGAPDKMAYVCRLLRKAASSGAKVVVLVPDAMVGRLDADLWALSSTDFVPHCSESASGTVKRRSAVVIASNMAQAPTECDVLVNATDAVPSQFVDYARLIEVVSTDDVDRRSARVRWKHYADLGYPITRHDLALRGGTE
jgi:DNA polymerase-3 subunit chi